VRTIPALPAIEHEPARGMERAVFEQGLAERLGRGAEPIACTLAP